MSDLINKFVSDDAKQPLIEINGLFQDLVKSLKEVHAENKGIDVKINGAGSIKDLTSLMKQIADMQKQMGAMGTSIDQYNKLLKDTNTITQKLALAETEEAKAMMQAKVALEEKNRELKKSAQLENELYLARQKKPPETNLALYNQEVNALLAVVNAHNAAAEAYRKEAADKAMLAAQSTDNNEKSRLEAQVLIANAKAAKESAAAKNALKTANRDVAAEVAKTLTLEQQAEAQTRKNIEAANAQVAADARVAAGIEKMNGAYAQLSKAYSEAALKAKNLGAQALTDSSVQLEYQKAAKAAQEMQNQLSIIDANVGQHTRNVGNYKSAYNGLAAQFNQLTRELPALAINANTFFLALSNNIPMFIDEVKKSATATKAARAENEAMALAASTQAEAAAIAAGATNAQAKAAGKLAAAEAIATSEQIAAAVATGIEAENRALAAGQTAAQARQVRDLAQAQALQTAVARSAPSVIGKLAAAVFSWQTLLSVGVALLTIYGGKIVDWMRGITAAERAFTEAKEKETKAIAQEVGAMLRLQSTLNDTTKSEEQRKGALDNLNAAYPGYINNLSLEKSNIDLVNVEIERQIDLLRKQAEAKAADAALTAASEEFLQTQMDLTEAANGNAGAWHNFKAVAKNTFTDVLKDMKLTAEQQRKFDDLWKNESPRAATGYKYALLQQAEAQKEVEEAIQRTVNVNYDKIKSHNKSADALLQERKALENEIEKEREAIKVYGEGINHTKDYIAIREQRIAQIDRTVAGILGEIAAMQQQGEFEQRLAGIRFKTLSDEERTLLMRENAAAKLQKGTKQRLAADRAVLDAKADMNAKQLIAEFRKNKELKDLSDDDIKRNQDYILKLENMNLKLYDKTDNAKAKAAKKEAKEFDPTKEILAQNQRVFAANQEFDKSQLEATNAHLENIFSIESNSLKKRLDAYEQYVANLAAISEIDYKTAITEKQKQLDAILAIEKKYNVQITEENQAEFSKRKNLSGDERSLILQKFALMQELSVASAKQAETILQINEKAQKREREIIDSSIKYQVNVDKENYARLRDQTSKEVALRIDALNKRRTDGTVGEKAFWKERQYILSSESGILFEKEMEFLKERKDKVIAQLMDTSISDADRKSLQALQENIDVMFGNLERQRPEPRRVEKKSILSYLGFPAFEGNEAQLIDQSIREFQRQQDEQNMLIQIAKDVRAQVIEDAALRYRVGSKEYAQVILDAAKGEAEAIAAAEAIKSSAAKSQEAAEKARNDIRLSVIEKQKEEIAKAIGDLMSTLRAAQNAALEAELSVIKSQMDAIDQRSEKERKAVEESILGEKEKAEKIKEIENAAFVDKENLSKREKKLRREQALNDRSVAIFQATISGSLAIQRAIAAGSVGSPVLAGIYAALIGAMTAAQIAAISSAPLPEYWKGTPDEGHKGGLAIVGERGTELGILPSGQQFLTPDTATIMDLPKGTEIIPNHDLASYTADMSNQEMKSLRDTNIGGAFLTQAQMETAFAKSAEKIIKAIANKQEVHFGWSNGELVKSIKNGNQVTKWVGGLI